MVIGWWRRRRDRRKARRFAEEIRANNKTSAREKLAEDPTDIWPAPATWRDEW